MHPEDLDNLSVIDSYLPNLHAVRHSLVVRILAYRSALGSRVDTARRCDDTALIFIIFSGYGNLS